MKTNKKIILSILAWHLLFTCFYIAYFIGHELPELGNFFYYFFAIPYFGFGAFFWSLLHGIGVVVLVLGLTSSIMFFKKGKWLYFLAHLLVGLIGGGVFRFVNT